MKIGILTFHRPANFGANLQAFSSYRYFSSLGHVVKLIDYVRDVDDKYSRRVCELQVNAHLNFIRNNLPLTAEARTVFDLQEIVFAERFDLIVIGADAVWRKSNDNVYFAEWLFHDERIKNIPVASLSAAHMGNGFNTLSQHSIDEIRNCLTQFKYISVRDSWTRDCINRDVFGGSSVVSTINPDPVFLIDRFIDKEWDAQGLLSKKYVLLSLPSNWRTGKLSSLRKYWFYRFKKKINTRGLKLVELPIPEGTSGMPFDYTIPYPIDPIQWYLFIKNAYAFCGLRFHAVVSCISAGTPFFSIDTYGNVSRKKWLLTLLGFHKLSRNGDANSKINNMLQGSGFEDHRVDLYIENLSPKYIYKKLKNTSREDILRYRDSMISLFKNNVSDLLKSI